MKIYYLPGAISLIFLPLMCLLYLHHRGVFEEKHMIRVFAAPDEAFEHNVNGAISWEMPERVDYQFVISGNPSAAKADLFKSHTVLHQIMEARDTTHGLVFRFDAHSTYGMFVEALNICLKEKALYWITPERNIWAFYAPPIDHSKAIVSINFCGTGDFYFQPEPPKTGGWYGVLVEYFPVWVLLFFLAVGAQLARGKHKAHKGLHKGHKA